MNEYIDVRGPWPVYFNGLIAVELIGWSRATTIYDVKIWMVRNTPLE